jgi:hypothetical protein
MKLRVQHEDGSIEVLTLSHEWRVIEGKHLNRIVDGNGFEHFFTPEGHYDGWGGNVRQPQDAADDVLESMEEKRQIERPR